MPFGGVAVDCSRLIALPLPLPLIDEENLSYFIIYSRADVLIFLSKLRKNNLYSSQDTRQIITIQIAT